MILETTNNHIELPSQPSSTVEPSGSLMVVVTVP
jgi:hypothetical protein